jgi:hypothetical protein
VFHEKVTTSPGLAERDTVVGKLAPLVKQFAIEPWALLSHAATAVLKPVKPGMEILATLPLGGEER